MFDDTVLSYVHTMFGFGKKKVPVHLYIKKGHGVSSARYYLYADVDNFHRHVWDFNNEDEANIFAQKEVDKLKRGIPLM